MEPGTGSAGETWPFSPQAHCHGISLPKPGRHLNHTDQTRYLGVINDIMDCCEQSPLV
jgi:hypothetical protein